ncbi:MAG: ABC transporter ATP-binding protein [Acidobacteria bacterium]|nr:ABC transporter ATP-binding protein [Acidobacteriota bacterium]MBV9477696.1 ABC transporter ATP-binding protein [Acidobacteriota bacterium]
MSFALHEVAKAYGHDRRATPALAGVSFAARGAEFLTIVGPSGCGKTTLLKIIAGLIAPSAGRVAFDDPAGARLRTSLVFQDHGLLPWYDVHENVALGLRFQDVGRAEARERARHFIVQVGLERFLRHHPHELSIGMRQRVGIARAFVADPQILLLDEPFGSLDAQTKLVLQQELLRIWQEHRKLVVHVTHDIEEAILLSDRILVMSGRPGRIREEIRVPFARPRDLGVLDTRDAADIRRRIWDILEEEVRQSLWVPQ